VTKPVINGPSDLERVANIYSSIIRFMRSREQALRAEGLEPLQYQFLSLVELLHQNGHQPNISALGNQLDMYHHSAVELVDRLAKRGFVERRLGRDDRRHVFLYVTARGRKLLKRLTLREHSDVCQFAPELLKNWKALVTPVGKRSLRRQR
jgi:DNA-binding MarR family transcriptional regulator